MAMGVYLVVALIADLNALSSVNTQDYQTSDAFAAQVANHFFPFLALATHKKGVSHATQGRNTPTKKHKKAATAASLCVVVFGQTLLCYGYWFSLTAALRLFRFRYYFLSFGYYPSFG
jgi:hypothetical protein